jgi:plastocyanin
MPDALTAAAGDVVFFLDNASPGIHMLAIGPNLDTPLAVSSSVRVGHSAVFTVHGLDAGEYAIWCPVDNHAAEGMVGTLTVS